MGKPHNDIHLPIDVFYLSQTDASNALRVAVAESFGKHVKPYINQSSNTKNTFIYLSSIYHFKRAQQTLMSIMATLDFSALNIGMRLKLLSA